MSILNFVYNYIYIKTRKFGGKKRVKSRKKYSRKAGVLNRPSNMLSLRVEKDSKFTPGVRTTRRQRISKKELMKTLALLIHKIENERDENEREKLEKQLVDIAQLISEY